MKKIIINYFSGTGNTKLVSELVRDAFYDKGVSVDLHRIEDMSRISYDTEIKYYDAIGIAYPIYGGGTPRLVEDLIDKMPEVSNKPVFIYKTAADFISFNYYASKRIIRKLIKKGYDVFYDRIFAMGSNWWMKYDDRFSKLLYETAIDKTKHMRDEILSGKRRRYRLNPILSIMISLLKWGESKIAAPIYGRLLKVLPNCTDCGRCITDCSVGNIYKDKKDKIKFGWDCIWCMRCLYNCPVTAIKPRIFGFVAVKGGYNIYKIIKDDSISSDFIKEKGKGYYKHFNKYLDKIEI
jgi:flavodoxin/ferredoxin